MLFRKREDIVITYGADDSKFKKVTKGVGKTGKRLGSLFGDLGNQIGSFLGLGFGLGAGGIAAGLAKLTSDLDELGKTAEGLNTTVEELHALRFAVSQTSTVTDRELDTSLQKLIKHIGQANRGVKTSQQLFRELGLDWEYLSTLGTDQAFLEVADAVAVLPDKYKQASLAQKLFEDSWRKLLPTLLQGRDGLKGLIDQAKALGGPTTEATKAAADLNDAMGRMSQTLSGVALEYGPDVITWLNGFVAVLTGTTGAITAIDTLDEKLSKLYDMRQRLTGQGNALERVLMGITRRDRAKKRSHR